MGASYGVAESYATLKVTTLSRLEQPLPLRPWTHDRTHNDAHQLGFIDSLSRAHPCESLGQNFPRSSRSIIRRPCWARSTLDSAKRSVSSPVASSLWAPSSGGAQAGLFPQLLPCVLLLRAPCAGPSLTTKPSRRRLQPQRGDP